MRRNRIHLCLLWLWLLPLGLAAQITIGGNVYGGGNAGNLGGNTCVTICAGNFHEVYGGARQANVDDSTYVNIDGKHASDYIIINKVFGGNDIAGIVGSKTSGLDACVRTSTRISGGADANKIFIGQLFGGGNGDYDYTTTTIGEGGDAVTKYVAKKDDVDVAVSDTPFDIPELDKSYVEVRGGTIGFAYGGGNNATVRVLDSICVDNLSETVVNHIKVNKETAAIVADNASGENVIELLDSKRFDDMGIHLAGSLPESDEFLMGWVFGGNNKAEMDIIPKWNLKSGSIRNLYSGGNAGSMTSPTGILLEIMASSTIKVDNVFGGCRKADVKPMVGRTLVDHVYNPIGYKFPNDLAARLLIRGGDINNVYGGNDISGKVYFGNAVGVYTSVRGNVYGGGNGSYAYTDNPNLKDDPYYGEYYYDPLKILGLDGDSFTSLQSAEALDLFRPNAEQVSLRLAGTDANHPTIISGSVYVGGNSATLKKKEGQKDYLAELKIGSHVIAENVFLGNNGEDMVKHDDPNDALRMYAGTVKDKLTNEDLKFSQMDLTDAETFSKYMEGCAMNLMPHVVFDKKPNDPDDYEPYSSYFGSFYCGGNVGSLTEEGTDTLDFNYKVIIYNKLVGGCNNAIVPESDYNAYYEGGVIGSEEERKSASGLFTDRDGNIKNRIILNLANLSIEPKRWAVERNGSYEPILTNGKPTYKLKDGHRYLEWNTVDSRKYDTQTKTYKEMAPVEPDTPLPEDGKTSDDDLARRFYGGSIYGGCCKSGIVNGNVVINLDAHIVEREKVFDEVQSDELGEEESLYGSTQTEQAYFKITKRRTGVILAQQGMDVLGSALNVFGGGKGKDTEIWGSTVINLNRGYTFQIFGGSEDGVIGKPLGKSSEPDYQYDPGSRQYHFNGKLLEYNPKFSCYVNLCGTKEGVSKKENTSEEMAACEFMYGGGFFGPICGNTVINLGNGRIFNSFASCNGDILGTAETFIGRQVKDEYKIDRPANVIGNDVFKPGFPWVRDIVYGANDLGGRILGESNYKDHVRGIRPYDPSDFDVIGKVHPHDGEDDDSDPDVLKASAYVEYLQGRADGIFGGCYGTYDYSDPKFNRYCDNEGEPLKVDDNPIFFKPRLNNAFVNFRPTYSNPKNVVKQIFGAGEGEPGETDRDLMQNRSYVLIDIPDDIGNYDDLEVFGAGAWGGVGMGVETDTYEDDKDLGSAIIDLVRGKISSAYGGSYEEGITRRTLVNVPEGSTICMYSEEPDQDEDKTKHIKEHGNIFGGAYGTQILPPCDVIESNVNYRSRDAVVCGAIYGGNNSERRTVYTHVNIYTPVWSTTQKEAKGYLSTVYGAGQGIDTWAEYTEVNLHPGAQVYEVFGGGMMGHVLNAETVQKYMHMFSPNDQNKPSTDIATKDPNWSKAERWNGEVGTGTLKPAYTAQWAKDWKNAWGLGEYYKPNDDYNNYISNPKTNLTNTNQVRSYSELNDNTANMLSGIGEKYNTNVIINDGAYVANYAYGGGYGKSKAPLSGDIYGRTYIALLGGTVDKDIYAAGTAGSVDDIFNADFTASTNAYIKGGKVRNVYGGGWEGSVGYHVGDVDADPAGDRPGVTHVVIGIASEDATPGSLNFKNGIPSIERNTYGGGEGGAVWGTTNVTMLNGYVGYRYHSDWTDDASTADIDERYEEKIDDETRTDGKLNTLYDSGCIFGGGYIANSSVDKTNIYMYNGHVRNAIFGGGEIAAVGRGKVSLTEGDNPEHVLQGIYRPGKTLVEMYQGHVHRNVFGGGRGYNNLGDRGELNTDGFVFGQTEVHIHGGEVGTTKELALGNGNVYGGGDVGFVYSALEDKDGTFYKGVKDGVRYDGLYQGYYYKHDWSGGDFKTIVVGSGTERILTEDCKVLIEPYSKASANVSCSGIHYAKGHIVSNKDLDYLKNANMTSVLNNIDDYGKVTAEDGISFNRTYKAGEFVTIEALNTLKNKNADSRWASLDSTGVVIHNAVFAGGNTSTGSSAVHANTTSIFGNATASVHDVYHRDLITVGTGHTGGLYGEGNLTFVDGYRGLNITNYGTDYYSISKEIDIKTYHAMPAREAAYYELKYKCIKDCTDKEGTDYKAEHEEGGRTVKASTLNADDLIMLFEGVKQNGVDIVITNPVTGEKTPNPTYWSENGVLPVYAGRLMNTIQRADFCGVFGSRMVMRGAQDRVPEVADFSNYTINRVREVSLNKKRSTAGDAVGSDGYEHGNYFGIYSIVNFLGALTSDFDFGGDDDNYDSDNIRTTDNTDTKYKADIKIDGQADIPYGNAKATFYNWKKGFKNDRRRNNGSSHNKVALASGVYLELTTERSTGTELNEKDWGLITGVIELDLINVQQGIGGGFVYAKNQHGLRKKTGHQSTTLTALNSDAVTQWDFEYETDDTKKEEWQTSGNFVHSTQTIIDDCYNISGKYKGTSAVPAHYWYIKGQVYIYDQYISAYTGAPNAYSETVDIPLTITAASHGTMKLLNVMPNRYAYYRAGGSPLEEGQKLVINDVTYYKNSPISYWDWYMLPKSEQSLFVEDTYVVIEDCWIGSTEYKAGTVMLKDDYKDLRDTSPTVTQKILVNDVLTDNPVDFDFVFRSSNNLSHDTGYILTYKVNNPTKWDTWYTEKDDNVSVDGKAREKNQKGGIGYEDGPTYHVKGTTGSMLGQQEYEVGDIISKNVEDTYQEVVTNYPSVIPTNQAKFEPAYIVTNKIEVEGGHLYPGNAIAKSDYEDESDNWLAEMVGNVAEAYVCTSTIQLSPTEYIYLNAKMTEGEKNNYITRVKDQIKALGIANADAPTDGEIAALSAEQKKKLSELQVLVKDINAKIVRAYYCKSAGLYGGDYYTSGVNYRALEAWSSMSEEDRAQFEFNYDALDLLIDPTFSRDASGNIRRGKVDDNPLAEGKKYQYDSASENLAGAEANAAGYSLTKPVDYTATYDGTETSTHNGITLAKGTEYQREDFEKLPNEKRHYASIKAAKTVYVVNTNFQIGNSPYAVGTTIEESTYNSLNSSEKQCVTVLEFSDDDVRNGTKYYFCRESYTVGENTEGVSVTNLKAGTGYDKNGASVPLTVNQTFTNTKEVPVGVLISEDNYLSLQNWQTNFTIHGIAPLETSTLYVSRESDIYDLSTEKIITVIYQYDYEESDEDAANITPVSERHVLNIHITFKSGVPQVEDITPPSIVLPGTYVGLREPVVTPGAYEVTGGGWKLFEKTSDAESHTNGIEYTPNSDPLYWYQDGYLVAYYAKTYLGETYSNAVPVSVANYHDLKKVMDAKEHHYYIDIPDLPRLQRVPKVYINNYTTDDPATSKNGLDMFKALYDLSLITTDSNNDGLVDDGDLEGHALLNSQVHAGQNLEFFLRTDLDYSAPSGSPARTWTPIGTDAASCFEGTLHGDGHTISGLDHSLFNYLCGDVYNLGVTGSFTGGGVAETGTGYVENCWVKTSATSGFTPGTKAVFGNPSRGQDTQVVNCYYPESNAEKAADDGKGYSETSHARGNATKKPDQAFYNGEVAYDLNGFYLYKRYCDNASSALGGSPAEYSYWQPGTPTPQTGHYGSDADLCSAIYVENRFTDGDFIYADGTIPETENERLYVDGEGNRSYYPIWPDDYLFFGQALNYGHMDGNNGRDLRTPQDLPSAVVKSNTHIQTDKTGNRVYRAPAYFRSSKMGMAHFNRYAVFAQSKNKFKPECPDTIAYRNMTAIDFTGYNDVNYPFQKGWQQWSETSQKAQSAGMSAEAYAFYPPLLDDDGIADLYNADLTRNLLVYTGTFSTAAAKTDETVAKYLPDEAYVEEDDAPVRDPYYDTSRYHSVRELDVESDRIRGHRVQKQDDGTFLALNDHVLVDLQDFNAPMAYTFDDDYRMWYQRIPDNYVGKKKDDGSGFIDTNAGWEGISLPFKAEIVTTNRKGEITHFYNNSGKDDLGHEYWLREFVGGSISGDDFLATLNYPNANSADGAKDYTNTFLWDYYYSYRNDNPDEDTGEDHNKDEYQENDANRDYYKHAHSFSNYPRMAAATPYIIGFPGERYYEFDLSGNFLPVNTNTTVWTTTERELKRQAITFASKTGIAIGISDNETGVTVTESGNKYTFRTSYLNQTFPVSTANTYTLDADGNSYDLIPTSGDDPVTVSAFRPYFLKNGGPSGAPGRMTRSIIFSKNDSSFPGEDFYEEPQPLNGFLDIRAIGRRVLVTSYLEDETTVTIVTAAGALLDRYTITPGQTVETRINTPGVYLVNRKKLSIK